MIFQRFLLANIIYSLAVIVWGALVRASGSGAGCGAHWPLCHGQVVVVGGDASTWIELVHRLMSGGLLITVVISVVFSFRLYASLHPVRASSLVVLAFVLIESLIGAVLVLLKLVGENSSPLRAYVMGAHLINTFFFLASQYVHYRLTYFDKQLFTHISLKKILQSMWFVCSCLLLVTAAIGAMVALGDTLFATTAQEHASHFLVRLRIYHPALAIVTVLAIGYFAHHKQSQYAHHKKLVRSGNILLALAVLQIVVGGINWLMHVPISTQLIHLFFACIFWLQHVAFGLHHFEARHMPLHMRS